LKMPKQDYHFQVAITCDGCVKALNKSLTKTFGDKLVNWDANVDTKRVVVTIEDTALPTYDDVMNAVKKCGKETSKIE